MEGSDRSTSRHVKTSLLQQEALSWKHGVARPLHDGEGDPECFDFYRNIILNGVASKCWHRFLRQQVAGYLGLALRESQRGGRVNHGPGRLFHAATSYIQAARLQQRSPILAFVDLNSAFYSAVRSLAVPSKNAEDDDEHALHHRETPFAMILLYTFALQQP